MVRVVEDGILEKRLSSHQADAAGVDGDHPSDFLGDLLSAMEDDDGRSSSLDMRTIRWALHDMLFSTIGETASSTFAAAIALLAAHQDIQHALREEVLKGLSSRDGARQDGAVALGAEDFEHMPLLNAVIQETMRLYPGAGPLSRLCTGGPDVIDGYTIQEGDLVVISPTAVHRSPRVWHDPHRFDPGRFMPGGEHSRLPWAAWIPFGAGHHSCIGSGVAMLEAQAAIAALLPTFRFDRIVPPPDESSSVPTGILEDGSLNFTLTEATMRFPDGLVVQVERL